MRSAALSVDPAPREGLSCLGCAHLGACMPAPAATAGARTIRLVARREMLLRHAPLVVAGDGFAAVYGLRSGLLKSTLKTGPAAGLVTGIFFPGDVAGLDGIAWGHHPTELLAVTDAEICTIPFARLETLARRSPRAQRHLHRLLSREIAQAYGVSLPLGRLAAAERVAAFLLRFGQAQSRAGGNPLEFVLPLTLEEMGSHLGLTMETVSRVLSQLVAQRLIVRQGRTLRIVHSGGLEGLARPQRPVPQVQADATAG